MISSCRFHLASSAALAKILPMQRTALIGFLIGMTLGCLFGAVTDFLPARGETQEKTTLSVNQATGKPQLHVKGRPDLN